MTSKFAVAQLSKSCSVQGKFLTNLRTKQTYYQFLGIPYAEQPVGDHRFKETKPLTLWSGLRDCNQYGSISPQDLDLVRRAYYPYDVPTSFDESCLYLNIWTTSIEHTAKLPVMIWIHGGSFSQGFSNFYDGTILTCFGHVVTVSINYRLGPFGFLYTNDGTISGNMGLLDQVEAMKWVQKYIKSFGGDPNNVTIFGESAGAISVGFHLLSPLTKGLFHKAILQSGTAIHPSSVWLPGNAHKFLITKLQKSGFTGANGADILKYLNTQSTQNILQILGTQFQPIVDGVFLPDDPQQLLSTGRFHSDVDVIVGFNSHEGAQFLVTLAKTTLVSSIAKAEHLVNILIKKMFFRNYSGNDGIIERVNRMYLSNATNSKMITEALVDLYGDLLFVAPCIYFAQLYETSAKGDKCVYMYEFSHRASYSPYDDWILADHGFEVPFVFGEPFLNRFGYEWTNGELQLSENLVQMWTSFAKTGKPSLQNKEQVWQPAHGGHYLQIDKLSMADSYNPDRMKLWIDIMNEFHQFRQNQVTSSKL